MFIRCIVLTCSPQSWLILMEHLTHRDFPRDIKTGCTSNFIEYLMFFRWIFPTSLGAPHTRQCFPGRPVMWFWSSVWSSSDWENSNSKEMSVVCLSIGHMSVWISVYLYLSVYLTIYPSSYMSVFLSVYVFVYLFLFVFCLSAYLFISMSVCLSVCFSTVCLEIYLSSQQRW